MEKTKKTGPETLGQQQVLPLARDYVAEVQQRAEQLAHKAVATAGQTDGSNISRQNRHVQEEMARLRSEAVHARRLAEQIEPVSLPDRARHETQLMATISKTASEPDQLPERRRGGAPRAGGGRLDFNPLHPSMELPPEQLIRLLGLETKKTRKGEAHHPRKPRQKPVQSSAGHGDITPAEQLPPPMRAQRSYAAVAHSQFRKRRRGLLLPAIAVGILAGLSASGYFFWHPPAPVGVHQKPPGTASDALPRKAPSDHLATPSAAHAPTQPSPKIIASKPAARVDTPTVAGAMRRAAPPQAMVNRSHNPEWQAAAEAERMRLRAEAEQRFAERLRESRPNPAPTIAAPSSAGPVSAAAASPLFAESETTSSRQPHELDSAQATAPPLEAGSDDESGASPVEWPAEPATEPRLEDNPMAMPEPAPAEASQNQGEWTEPGIGLDPPARPDDTVLTPLPAAVEPAAAVARPQQDIETDAEAFDAVIPEPGAQTGTPHDQATELAEPAALF